MGVRGGDGAGVEQGRDQMCVYLVDPYILSTSATSLGLCSCDTCSDTLNACTSDRSWGTA